MWTVCSTCGAICRDYSLHEAWHAENDSTPDALEGTQ